jgi:mRNA-degrading endonuclease RelE of RelBE toxin-antitoxin system
MKENNPTCYGISMTSSTRRKLKSLKKKIAERHSEKPEENETPIEKNDLKKDR